MSSAHIEPEMLAAFLDGAASPEERDLVFRTIAGSKAAYSEFLEASAIQRELESGELKVAHRPVAADRPSDPEARPGLFRFLAPIAILAAASVVFFVSRNSRAENSGVITVAQSTRIAGATATRILSRVLGAEWDAPAWSVTRGGAPARASYARTFRAGVRFAQLEVAVHASDSAAVTSAIGQLQELLTDVLGSAPLASRLNVMETTARFGSAADRREIAAQLKLVLGDENWFDLGVWTGAAQLAAKSGQDVFFAADGPAIAELTKLLTRKFEPTEQWVPVSVPVRSLVAGEWRSRAGGAAILPLLTRVLSSAGG